MLTLIVAMDRQQVIGVNNTLPWRLSADLRHFKALTLGQTVIMGRITWESIGKPLPNRQNIILTSNPHFTAEGCQVATSLENAIKMAQSPKIFIIGGGQIYKLALAMCDEMVITHVDTTVNGDAWFPTYDKQLWQLIEETSYAADEKNEYPFKIAVYRRKLN